MKEGLRRLPDYVRNCWDHHGRFCAGALIALICGSDASPFKYSDHWQLTSTPDYTLHALDGILHKERENSMIDVDRLTDEGVKG
jgi:hypothetical protein